MRQRVEGFLDDPEVEVRALALSIVLSDPSGPASERATHLWEAMLDADDKETQL